MRPTQLNAYEKVMFESNIVTSAVRVHIIVHSEPFVQVHALSGEPQYFKVSHHPYY